MGKITFTPLQKSLFEKITQHPFLSRTFYFTGGTALSAVYLHHRESEDLDFFSETDFDDKQISDIIDSVASSLQLTSRFTKHYRARIFELVKNNNVLIKIDFVYNPHKRLEKGIDIKGFPVDSLRDIATNKLLTINQRIEAKDFVDLYFLLKEFTIWDLIYAVKTKYNMEFDIILVGADFLKAETFNFLPKMNKPLSLEKLKSFFRGKAKEIGKRAVE
ncbi:MAG: nucleotidyl transferase AbiEii/AbiGii toxin family protein [Candidatus Levybacteria bacterium]|nr:nucleotidyl transferase AbiEii/AbiGii toxin family protein [Candidatus Levybacteria bacterium]